MLEILIEELKLLNANLALANALLTKLATAPAVGMVIEPGTPTHRDSASKGSAAMPTMKLIKKSSLPKSIAKKPAAAAGFGLIDNEDDTFTVTGVDSQGQPVDISVAPYNAVLSSVVSSDPAVLTVDAPIGMTFKGHALTVGHTDITATATLDPASPLPGPLNATLPTDVAAGGPTGLIITPGTPIVRP